MLTDFLGNISVLVGIITVFSEYLSKATKANGFWSQVQSWVVAVVAAFISNYLGYGFPNATLATTLLYGLIVGLISNGFFKIPWVQTILVWIKARFIPVPTPAVSLAAPTAIRLFYHRPCVSIKYINNL